MPNIALGVSFSLKKQVAITPARMMPAPRMMQGAMQAAAQGGEMPQEGEPTSPQEPPEK